MKTICFIPVRKGSKGIPGKNIRLLGNKPLLCWITDTVLNSRIADELWVATDCDLTENLLRERYGASIRIFRRSANTASDESPMIEVVREFLEKTNPQPDDVFILLQATSPFTCVNELYELQQAVQKKTHHSFIACCRLKKFHWSEDGKPMDYTWQTKPRRQEYRGILIETGSFYASTVDCILRSGQLLSGAVKIIETGPAGMIDIDEESDWEQAEQYIKTHQTEQ